MITPRIPQGYPKGTPRVIPNIIDRFRHIVAPYHDLIIIICPDFRLFSHIKTCRYNNPVSILAPKLRLKKIRNFEKKGPKNAIKVKFSKKGWNETHGRKKWPKNAIKGGGRGRMRPADLEVPLEGL